MKRFTLLTALSAALLLPATLGMAFELVITTADGVGADANVTTEASGAAVGPDGNLGDADNLVIWDFTAEVEELRYKAYARFDLSPIVDTIALAKLTFTTIDGQFAAGTTIWSLNDGDAGELWEEMEITWNNAPANDLVSATEFLANATFLGEFENISNVAGGTGDFSGAALTDFLNADTDGVATLMFASPNGFTYIAPKEHLTLDPPTLTVEVGSIAGDLNGDGFVGQADLDIVLGAWGQTVPPADPRADPSGDDFVGQGDLDTVLGDWGKGTPPPAPVPEPATVVLLGLGALALARRRQH